ncbi:hypothetical protein [Limnohabitans sp. Jir72]|uniref:hypothetical protein n=1 Tax=Limnohabitans sp. Jir72 TaxID=1977909 RepID=UPI000D388028|nr:hypothetical protein [Limnohabitans sp. Jir72]PUE33978.1 hypothetical protein B9Z52_07790 [Limnohabitans sp. Jir72]
MTNIESIQKLIPITENALKVRDWERSNLPIEQSALALDLFLVIAYNTIKSKPLTLKLLFHTIDFSEAGIRKHLKRLLADGWCSLEGAEHDKRLRLVVAQPKMLNALTNYSEILKDAFGNKAQTV